MSLSLYSTLLSDYILSPIVLDCFQFYKLNSQLHCSRYFEINSHHPETEEKYNSVNTNSSEIVLDTFIPNFMVKGKLWVWDSLSRYTFHRTSQRLYIDDVSITWSLN